MQRIIASYCQKNGQMQSQNILPSVILSNTLGYFLSVKFNLISLGNHSLDFVSYFLFNFSNSVKYAVIRDWKPTSGVKCRSGSSIIAEKILSRCCNKLYTISEKGTSTCSHCGEVVDSFKAWTLSQWFLRKTEFSRYRRHRNTLRRHRKTS